MIHHVFSVACRYASVDQFSNTLALADILENVQITERPPLSDPPVGLPIETSVVSVWLNDGSQDEEARLGINLVVPDGRILRAHETPMTVKAGQSHRTIAKTPALPYCGDGRYWFEVSVFRNAAWERVARLPFGIHVVVGGAALTVQ